jgi:hypothetical protein
MQSNNNNTNNDDGFKLASKKGKKGEKDKQGEKDKTIETIVPIVLSCDHCQKLWHTKDKCFKFLSEQEKLEKLEKLKTTECVYCHNLGHTNFDCPVSKANAEKKRLKAAKQQSLRSEKDAKEAKFNAEFPKVLSSVEAPIVSEKTMSAWASVAMANRDPGQVKKLEEEDLVLQEKDALIKQEKRRLANWEKKQEKLAAEKAHWYKIKPVVIAMKAAFPKSWIHKVDHTPYDTNQASKLRWEEDIKREEWEFEQEKLEWEENERYLKESRLKEAEREKMTPKELEEDYQQADEDYEDARMNEENLMFSRMFCGYSRTRNQCASCSELLEQDNQGSQCIACIFKLGSFAMNY